MQYKHTEIAAPARKLCNNRLLSFVGTKVVFSVLVNSKIRRETCKKEKSINIQVPSQVLYQPMLALEEKI